MQETFGCRPQRKLEGSAGHGREFELEDYGDESSQSDHQNYGVNINDQMVDREDDGQEMMQDMMDLRDDGDEECKSDTNLDKLDQIMNLSDE